MLPKLTVLVPNENPVKAGFADAAVDAAGAPNDKVVADDDVCAESFLPLAPKLNRGALDVDAGVDKVALLASATLLLLAPKLNNDDAEGAALASVVEGVDVAPNENDLGAS